MYRRHVLRTLAALGVGLAGCSANNSGSPDETGTSSDTGTPTLTTKEQFDPSELAAKPNYDHTLVVQNQSPKTQTITVRITHDETGEVVYTDTVTVDPASEIEVFDFSDIESEYDGVKTFEITAETSQHSESETFVTSECHGLPRITVSDNELVVTYAIC